MKLLSLVAIGLLLVGGCNAVVALAVSRSARRRRIPFWSAGLPTKYWQVERIAGVRAGRLVPICVALSGLAWLAACLLLPGFE